MVQKMQQNKQSTKQPAENLTGIPAQMKIDFEQRSGMSFDDVRVHYHSEEPAKLDALAFTRGEDIYIGPGQERHLRHELTHVVQQKQGLVTPTGMAGGLPVNNDPELERLAENGTVSPHTQQTSHPAVVQRVPTPGDAAAARFSQLVNVAALTLQPTAITTELVRIGVPQNIAIAAENACIFTSPQDCKEICKEVIKNQYDQLTNNTMGDDRIGNQQDPHLRSILTNVLTQIYLPLIPQVYNAGAANAGAISFMIWPGESAQDMRAMINEGIGRMNLLIAPQTPLPPVNISDTDFGGVTDSLHDPNVRGEQSYGLGAGPSQVMHEQGHHVENYLNVNEFANLHNYLYRHTDSAAPDRVSGWTSLAGIPIDTFFGGPGYNIDFPEMNFQNVISRNMPSGNGLIRFFLYNLGNGILSLFGNQQRGQRFIDDFFLQESNSSSTGYASLYDPETYETEFVSTTAELLSTRRGATKVITADPTRVALFVYLTNRGLYNQIAQAFFAQNGQGLTLDTFLSII